MEDKTKSVVLFGDSALGRFNRDRIKELEKKVPGIAVYNCAVGGWDTRDALKKVDFIAKLKPDFTVISITNDCWHNISLDEYKSNLNKIIESFKGSTIIIWIYPPTDERYQDVPNFNEALTKFGETAKEVANENELALINATENYGGLDKESYHIEDGIHLNEIGYEIFIKALAKLLV